MGCKYVVRPANYMRDRLNGDEFLELETWLLAQLRRGYSLDACHFQFTKKLGKILQGAGGPTRSSDVMAMDFHCRRVRFLFNEPEFNVENTDYGVLRAVWFALVDEEGGDFSSSGSESEPTTTTSFSQ